MFWKRPAEFWTIAKDLSNNRKVFLICFWTTPLLLLLLQWIPVPEPRDEGSAGHPQIIYKNGRKDMSISSEAVGLRCAKKCGSILVLLLGKSRSSWNSIKCSLMRNYLKINWITESKRIKQSQKIISNTDWCFFYWKILRVNYVYRINK